MSTIRVPVRDIVVDSGGVPTKVMQDFLQAVVAGLPSFQPLFATDFGVTANGRTDDTAAMQKAIDQAVKIGGASIVLPFGTILMNTVSIPSGTSAISISGQGDGTVLLRGADLAQGAGLLDISGSHVSLSDFIIDGNVTTPVGLLYNQDFLVNSINDPMAPSLTKNTSIWLHGDLVDYSMARVKIRHSGGYAVLLDGFTGTISNVRISSCQLENNRPNLFGSTAGQAIYGSWTGGIYINGDGNSGNDNVIKGLQISNCRFLRSTGNMIWSHLYALDTLHENFVITSNYFEDIGLDGIEIGGVLGGVVSDNVMRRIGYTTLTDTDQSVPRWLAGAQATALDSSGLVKGVNYQGNSFLSVNGGALDLDGHADSALTGNTVRIPIPGEPEYTEDQIAISGASAAGSTSYGVNLGNTSNTVWGGRNVTISGNTFLNLSGGSIRLYAARDCLVIANNIVAPDAPVSPPISYGPGGSGTNQRATNNIIKHNRFSYSPGSSAPFVFEDPTVAPFVGTDVNYVFGNNPIIGNGNAVEFVKNVNSGSTVYGTNVWF